MRHKESKDINHALRSARKERGWPAKKVAKMLKVSTCTYLRWERNEQKPHLKNIGQLCQLFKKTAQELGYDET